MRQTKTLRRLAALLCTLALALALAPAAGAEGAAPVAGANAGKHIYETHYATQEESFLFPNSQGGFTRVERVYENFARPIVVEEYNASFQLVTSRTFALELLLWGGFYSGSQYNFLMFSQSNDAEDDSREVLRVVKYSKDWERLGSVSICGENTFRLMRSGSLRCAEQDGILYIYSCHTMYKAQDGKNHQASVMFSVRESDMTYEVQKYFYVSHSFDQYILIDQQKRIVTADLGDAYPSRAINLQRLPANCDPLQRANLYEQTSFHSIPGQKGDNATGVCLGGFAETTDGYVSAFTVRASASPSSAGTENVFLGYTDKAGLVTREIQLNTVKGATPPKVVSTGLNGGYVMWNGGGSYESNGTLYYRSYSNGGALGPIRTASAVLSDCQPVAQNGKVVWYAADHSVPTFYTLDASGVTAVKASAAPGAVLVPGLDNAMPTATTSIATPKSPDILTPGSYTPTPDFRPEKGMYCWCCSFVTWMPGSTAPYENMGAWCPKTGFSVCKGCLKAQIKIGSNWEKFLLPATRYSQRS